MLTWLPDLWTIQDPGEIEALSAVVNFIPTTRGGMARSFDGETTNYNTALNGVCLAASFAKKSDGTDRFVAGSAAKIQEANGAGGWTDRSGTTYTATTWAFAAFGNDLIATNKTQPVQVSSGGAFADLGGSPPKAKHVITQSNCVLLFNINDGTDKPDGWASSDQNADTVWTITTTNFADSDFLYGGIGGEITAAATWQEEAIAWKKNAMYRGRFTGDVDLPWVWDFVSRSAGCPAQYGHIETEVGLVFVADADVMLYDGSPPRSIANDVIKYMIGYMGTREQYAFCTLDEVNKCVHFWICTETSAIPYTGINFVWNYRTGKWGLQTAYNLPLTGLWSAGVRNAKYSAFSGATISGGTNSNSMANLAFASDNFKLYNLSKTSTQASGILTAWEQGFLDKDIQATKLRLRFMMNRKATSATGTVTGYDANGNTQTVAQTSAMKTDATFDLRGSGRILTWSVSALADCEVLRMVPEYVDAVNPAKSVGRR